MAAGIAADRGSNDVAVPGRWRSGKTIDAVRTLCCLLIAYAGCTWSPGDANSAGRPAFLPAETLLLKPVDRGRLSSGFGVRIHPILKRRQMHPGIDWASPRGTAVRAAGHGIVVEVGRFGAYGNYVRIEHGATVATTYAHLERYAPGLRPGRLVRQGDLIGRVGSTGRATGPHLHYEVLVAGQQVDPLAVSPILSAHASGSPELLAEASSEGELGIGGPNTSADDAATASSPSAGTQDLRSLPPDAGGGMIRIADLLKLHP